MRDEHGGAEDVREFRLEGVTLAVTAAVLVLLLTGAFLLGRWVERRSGPSASGPDMAGLEDPLGNVASSAAPADVGQSADFFDTVEEGGQKEMEPGREVRRGLGRAADGGAEPPEQSPAGGDGIYFVQVWAGRDRQAAELLVDKLQKEGFGVRIDSDRVEGDTLYKVRVGGYETEPEAREMSAKLENSGYRGAWVTTVR